MENCDQKLADAIETIRKARLDAANGLPKELFLLISSLIPIANVDLLIVNEKGQLLLTWRDDEFYRKCWHIPGGCLRLGETMIQRVHKTARQELGVDVSVDEQPIAVRDAINPPHYDRKYPNEYCHNISVLYRCHMPEGYETGSQSMKEDEPGYQKWFSRLPENFVAIQHIYDDILKPWIAGEIAE